MTMYPRNNDYPVWVCEDCGREAAERCHTRITKMSTWHIDICNICRQRKPCTQPRDFGSPTFFHKPKFEIDNNKEEK
jgi:protein-arginine kinase activator protein McsA